MTREVAVALGSNLGDRVAHLRFASSRLRHVLFDLRVSSFIDTEPVGVGPQPRYLNAAAVGTYLRDDPGLLLNELLQIEQEAGRMRQAPGAARTLDVDLVLFGEVVRSEPGLTIPHPRFRTRRFVLEPLAEIAVSMVDPVTGLTVGELLARLTADR